MYKYTNVNISADMMHNYYKNDNDNDNKYNHNNKYSMNNIFIQYKIICKFLSVPLIILLLILLLN